MIVSEYSEACDLAMSLYKKHYMNESSGFELLDDVAGVLSQIDNMVCGLVKPSEYPRVTMQQIIDAGLNAFAVKLLVESIVANNVTETVKFKFKNVGITIEPLPEPPK